eukprot:TRINITY_DN2253_c0_g1_i1.p1 TRINITY_DN2253_c0_g1~~TRINITY_DN2253_c0_g1_i1.p1  ORF type:complete len:253 (-),score=23.07 TRINITY_DN2253_c0_g1_i1:62-820(-)
MKRNITTSAPPTKTIALPVVESDVWVKENVLWCGYANTHKRFFVVGDHNTIGGLPFPYLMIDSGCNTMLLPAPTDWTQLNRDYPTPAYLWLIGKGKGVGGKSPVISIKPIDGSLLDVTFDGTKVGEIDHLRFSLSNEDLPSLLACPHISPAMQKSATKMLTQHPLKPRQHGLVGQGLLYQFLYFQLDDFIAVLDRSVAQKLIPVSLLDLIGELAQIHRSWLSDNLETLNALEDDDHTGDDFCPTRSSTKDLF